MTVLLGVNAVLCGIAFAGLTWRLVGRWELSYLLARGVATLLTVAELIIALSAARRATLGGPFNEANYAILLHAIAVIALIVFWPWVLERDPPHRKEHSP